jgi:2-deoxy-D-gluconate 3-dehydrogenase
MGNPFHLGGRVAVVTGGNGGIGLGMAEGLGRAGAAVAVAARDGAKSADAVRAVEAQGIQAIAVAVDVADLASCEAMVAEIESRLGRLDIVVCNAGINIRKQPQDYDIDEWRKILAINLDGAFYTAKAAHPALKRQGGGKVITVGSMMSIFGLPLVAAYAARKGGVVQLTKALATAWAKDGIQVNSILPGWIDTDLTRRARVDIEGLHEKVEARTPAGRWGTPDDLAGLTVFLASPASDFITGTAIPGMAATPFRGEGRKEGCGGNISPTSFLSPIDRLAAEPCCRGPLEQDWACRARREEEGRSHGLVGHTLLRPGRPGPSGGL